jgi:hypothetical protein
MKIPVGTTPRYVVKSPDVLNPALVNPFTGVSAGKAFQEILTLQTRLLGAKELSPKELIVYQVKASQFGLQVELLSKVSESIVATVRKFQQNG